MGKGGGKGEIKRVEVPGYPGVTLVNIARAPAEEDFRVCPSGSPGDYEDHIEVGNAQFLCADSADARVALQSLGVSPSQPVAWEKVIAKARTNAEQQFLARATTILQSGKSAPVSQLLEAIDFVLRKWDRLDSEETTKVTSALQRLRSHPDPDVKAKAAEVLVEKTKLRDDPIMAWIDGIDPETLASTCPATDDQSLEGYPSCRTTHTTLSTWVTAVRELVVAGRIPRGKISEMTRKLRALVGQEWTGVGSGSIYHPVANFSREATEALMAIDRPATVRFLSQAIQQLPDSNDSDLRWRYGGVIEALSKTHIAFGNSGVTWDETEKDVTRLLAYSLSAYMCGHYACDSALRALRLYPHPCVRTELQAVYDSWVKGGREDDDWEMSIGTALRKIAAMERD